MKDQIEHIITKEIAPNLQADGGNIELIDVKDGIVKVKLTGSCAGCPMSKMTLQWGVERVLKQKVPGVVRVEAV